MDGLSRLEKSKFAMFILLLNNARGAKYLCLCIVIAFSLVWFALKCRQHGKYADARSAIFNNNLEELILLLKEIDVNKPCIGSGNFRKPLLHYACRASSPIFVETLLKAGADPSLVDGYGVNALHMACQRDNIRIVRLKNDTDNDGSFIVKFVKDNALYEEKLKIIELLTSDSRLDVNAKTNSGMTAFDFCDGDTKCQGLLNVKSLQREEKKPEEEESG